MTIAILLMLAGFLALYYGAEWLVDGAVTIANRLHISKVVAGVVLVAFGTSAPELFVNSIAAMRGQTGFALSNVSGSNLTNLLIGFGLCAILTQLPVDERKFRFDFRYFIVAPLVLLTLILFSGGKLPIWGSWVLFVGFASYLYLTKDRMDADEDEEDETPQSLAYGVLWFVIGVGLLYLGGQMTVEQATQIGRILSIDDAILGLTVVAFGTSIPDVMASLLAARAQENEIAVGNLLGSNIFNVLFILSMTTIFSWSPLSADFQITLSYAVVVLTSILFYLYVRSRSHLTRSFGWLLIGIYLSYIAYRIVIEIT